MKLNEFKKAKLNELDLSSFLGDYGSAAVRSGLGSLMGKNTLSTQDQMAKDQFIKNFTSRAASGLQSAINSGLVNPVSTATSGANIGTNMGRNTATQQQPATTAGRNVSPVPAQKRGTANKAGASAFDQMANQLTARKSPEQIRKEKQAAAAGVAQNQMAQNGPFSKLPANQPAVQAGNIRQQKQAQAATAAQGQMAPMSKLPADQFAKTAASTRQQQQGQAATTAQGQMNPVSKLPANQFAKSASNVRQAQQGQAATAAQGQMTPKVAGPTPKTPEQIRQAKQLAATQAAQSQMGGATAPAQNTTQPAQVDPRYPNGKYDGVTGKPTPEFQRDLDKAAAERAEKDKAAAIASQAQAKSNDDMAANMSNIAAQRNMPEVPQSTTPNISTGADAEQAALDKMKQKNPKLAGLMAQAGLDDNLDDIKPDNTVQMPKRNKKPKGKVAESQFDKLNNIFETILAEATMAQTIAPAGKVVGQANQQQSKQSISQYVTNFFKQFMKGVNISDPSVMNQVSSLAKQLEQTYAKDKGKTILPKLADLGWSVSHAQAEQQPQAQQATATKPTPSSTSATTAPTPQTAQTSQQAKMTVAQIKKLMQGLTTNQKKSLLASLEAEVNKTPSATKTKPSNMVKMPKIKGAKPGAPTPDEEAKLQQRIQQAAAQQK